MNLFRTNLYLVALALLTGCAPRVVGKLHNKNYAQFNETTLVYVLESSDEIPMNSEFIGDIKIGDSGFSTDCGYNKVMSTAKDMTRNAGANILKIIQLKKPNPMGSSCYRLQGKIYRNLDSISLRSIQSNRELRNKSTLPENADYAIIHFYRPPNSTGALLGYKIKTSTDSILGRVRNGERFDFKTKEFGVHTFYGELETKVGVSINIKKGEEYFVKCGVKYGIAIGRPEIFLIENFIGRKEYEKMK